ncbi:anti-phage dCTP deaminase [Mesorhizobium sp. B2-3-15]|uniref:anti-phage dCTP deaminase n=1 Tax=Mesorhizobium sp. B2-3-15 TaxID=2589949 RepID=UPI00112E1F7D|nr:anti-phage dCTP deaminase [Mesorhizobium sp. B2-3-15]TPL75965.1 deoxycytidylate deaminase [Mesorhizobium sp. B2-3-15]
MSNSPLIQHPELVFGLAGPLGVDLDGLSDSLSQSLRAVGYHAVSIKLTDEMQAYTADITLSASSAYHEQIAAKMDYATALCRKYGNPATMALIAIDAIQRHRRALSGSINKIPDTPTAYIVRQLKRPNEVERLRRLYGKQFVLVSAYTAVDERFNRVFERIQRSISTRSSPADVKFQTNKILERDADEDDVNGQHIRDTYHLADVFVDGNTRQDMDRTIDRFIKGFFGKTDVTPTKDEYGMYAAKSASLRSADLSRQVGAAIFSDAGEIITQGCNEVPKAFGGTYWDQEQPDFRDVKLGYDPNEALKKQIVKDLVERLHEAGMLSETCTSLGPVDSIVATLTAKRKDKQGVTKGPLADAAIMDLTEYGRIVHAEMCAICDAARLGRSVKGGTLFCTTFPCHNCTKHILAAGIRRVVYIEPYPKSRVQELHGHEVSLESESADRVGFVPFIGISPFRYRDIFQKGRRKNPDGSASSWLGGAPAPMLDPGLGAYLDSEAGELLVLTGSYDEKELRLPGGDGAGLSGDRLLHD